MVDTGKILADRYRLLEEVGRGGMAVVYRGFDERVRRTVAVKVLYPYLADRTESRIRFQREAEVVANLNHRNVVKVFDYSGLDSADNFIVAEFIEGDTLKHFVANNPIDLPEVGAMMAHEIASALDHAHKHHVIHRDVKPENVMIGQDGVLKLMDFGIAQIRNVQAMTVTGTMIGSPAHMSPEHIEGRRLDHRADVFSLGTVLYLLCTRSFPFEGNTAHALLRRILEASYVPALQVNPAVGRRLSGIIDRCLRREPEERYQSCAELRDDLADHLRDVGFGEPSRALAKYFKNPRLYQEAERDRLTNLLVERAGAQLKTGKRLGDALRLLDRALCLDPARTDIVETIDRLRRTQETKRLFVRYVLPALGVVLLGAAGAYVVVTGAGRWYGTGAGRPAADAVLLAGAGTPGDEVVAREEYGDVYVSGSTGDPTSGDTTAEGEVSSHFEESDGSVALAAAGPPPEVRRVGLDAVRRMRLLPDLVSGAASELAPVGERLKLALRPERKVIPADVRHVRAQPDKKGGKALDAGKSAARVGEDKGGKAGGTAGKTGKGGGGGAETADGTAGKLVPVTIMGDPPRLDIYVNGHKVGYRKVEGLMLKPGKHRLRLNYPGCDICADTYRDFLVEEGAEQLIIREEIGLKPARVRVSSVKAGMVFVDGVEMGTTNSDIKVPASGREAWKVKVGVVFYDSGLSPFKSSCELSPGKLTRVRALTGTESGASIP